MDEFDIISKHKGYFLCRKKTGFCQLVLDDFSQDLAFGKIMLHTEEIMNHPCALGKTSVFKLTLPAHEQQNIRICTLATGKKNNFIYNECIKLGGKWEPILQQWVFSASVQPQVNNLQAIIHSKQITLQLEFKETISTINKPLTLFGYPLIKKITPSGNTLLFPEIKLRQGDITKIPTVQGDKYIVIANSILRLAVPEKMLSTPTFHEDYLCAVNIKKITLRRKRKT